MHPRIPRGARRAALYFQALIVLVAGEPFHAAGQAPHPPGPAPDTTVYQFDLSDGSTVYGRVEAQDSATVTIRTVGGIRMEIPRDRILEMSVLRGRVVDGEVWVSDPNPTRLLFSSTGRSLRAGEGYVGTYLVVLPFAAVGVTDAITIAAGAPLTVGAVEPFYFAPKVRVLHREGADVSVGLLHFAADGEQGGLVYGVGTFGTLDHAFTAGLGFGYAGTDLKAEPVLLVGAEARAGRRLKFVSENYLIPSADAFLFSGALRIMGERFSTDVGVMGGAAGDGAACCLPIVNFSYAVGRVRDGGAGPSRR